MNCIMKITLGFVHMYIAYTWYTTYIVYIKVWMNKFGKKICLVFIEGCMRNTKQLANNRSVLLKLLNTLLETHRMNENDWLVKHIGCILSQLPGAQYASINLRTVETVFVTSWWKTLSVKSRCLWTKFVFLWYCTNARRISQLCPRKGIHIDRKKGL